MSHTYAMPTSFSPPTRERTADADVRGRTLISVAERGDAGDDGPSFIGRATALHSLLSLLTDRLVPVLTHSQNPIDVVRGSKVKDVFFRAKVPPSIGRKRSKNVSSSLAI